MSLEDDGRALILVYGDGRREAMLTHEHDGGEGYMGPLLRKAVQYARTHYDSGNIVDVLMSEGEMRIIDEPSAKDVRHKIRHVYYMTYRWDADTSRKTYHISAVHMRPGRCPTEAYIPELAESIPEEAQRIA